MASSAPPPVTITGIGLVSPLGHDLASIWTALRAGRSAPVEHVHRLEDEVWGRFPLFRVEGWEPRALPFGAAGRAYLDTHELWNDVDLAYLSGAAVRALADAGFDPQSPPADLGLVLAHENPGVDRHVDELLRSFHARSEPQRTRRQAADDLYAAHRDRVYDLQSFMMLHRVARVLGAHGHGLFVHNACASGLYAIDAAALLLQAGRCRTVVVAAADHPVSWTKHRWFAEQGLAAADGRVQPFDRARHGFVLGDGAAALVLERGDSGRSARPYAVYRGGGFDQEAWKVTLPDPSSHWYEAAMRRALDAAGIAPQDVDWVVAHAVATSVADAYEARSLTAVFGTEFEHPRLTGFKSVIGHNLGGSGLSETALLLLAMQAEILPPLRGCHDPDPALRLRPLGTEAREAPRLAMKCAAGFGGFNAACVFEHVE
jgi:3-oxoacyl-(acyl-carrier-protein) synthase